MFWGDNLQDSTPALYPRFDAGREVPAAFRSSFWEFSAEQLTQPLVAVHDGTEWMLLEGDAYALHEGCPVPVGFGFAMRNGAVELRCSIPAVQEPYSHTGTANTQPCSRRLNAHNGDAVVWKYRLTRLPGDRNAILPCLIRNYHASSDGPPSKPDPSPVRIASAARNGLMNWHYAPAIHAFKYTVAYDRVGQQLAECAGCTLDSTQMFLGWVSGWVVFEALLDYAAKFNDREARNAVIDVWTNMMDGAVSPSGFWWSRHVPAPRSSTGEPLRSFFEPAHPHRWDAGWMPGPTQLHMRTIGDAVLRAARSLDRHAAELPFADTLRDQILRQANLMASFCRKSPIPPLVVDAQTGARHGFHGTAGMIWLSVWIQLVRMGLWQDEDLIFSCADACRPAVKSGLLFGAPEDVGECVTSEDCYIALNVYCDLYEHRHDPRDLATALEAASWIYLWRKSFNTVLPRRTILGAYDLKSRGGDFASVKNNHLHVYGLDAEASLRKLARWTSDERWSLLADDHWNFASRLLSLEDGHFNGYEGMISEQFYFTNWAPLGNSVHHHEADVSHTAWDPGRHFRNRGNLSGFSTAWCAALLLAGALRRTDNPGAPMPDTTLAP